MDVKIIKEEKENLKLEIGNQTLTEILRVYLNKDDKVELAAWNRPHPDKPVIMEIVTKGKDPKKALTDAIAAVQKDANKYVDEFKKLK